MESEVILSGYCRQIDGSRTVMVEEDEADCLYPDCPYATNCPIVEKIDQCLQKIPNAGQG